MPELRRTPGVRCLPLSGPDSVTLLLACCSARGLAAAQRGRRRVCVNFNKQLVQGPKGPRSVRPRAAHTRAVRAPRASERTGGWLARVPH